MLVDTIPPEVASDCIGDNVVYRPELLLRSDSILRNTILTSGIHAVITHGSGRNQRFASLLCECMTDLVVIDLNEMSTAPTSDGGRRLEGLVVTTVRASNLAAAYRHSLEVLERYSIERIVYDKPCAAIVGLKPDLDVAVIGAGIVNLVTAYKLCRQGYAVQVFDASPDPAVDAPWRDFGCSRGGDDARMFTLSEMDNYNDRLVSERMNTVFNRNVDSLGWGASKSGSLSLEELSWISDYENLPIWLADKYNEDIFQMSHSSRIEWQEWIEEEPDLFKKCELHHEILRLYSDQDSLRKAVERQNRIGATLRVLSPEKVSEYQPALGAAVSAERIAGGIIVVGFTVNVHKFMACLISRMISAGVRFTWGQRAISIVKDCSGLVERVDFDNGSVTASNFVISPGAYAQKLLAGTKSEGKIHGVLGAWLRIPNLEPRLVNSLKLARKGHITEDANITVATDVRGEPIIIIGSGYGHTGMDPLNIDNSLLRKMYDGLIDTATTFFPENHRVAKEIGMIENSLKYCVRPWTANGLGLFEMLATVRGGKFVVTGGHNTGGFAQSPTIASAVLNGLHGIRHPMHTLYHPDRSGSFLERSCRNALPHRWGSGRTNPPLANSFHGRASYMEARHVANLSYPDT